MSPANTAEPIVPFGVENLGAQATMEQFWEEGVCPRASISVASVFTFDVSNGGVRDALHS